ncbi:RO-10 required for nuclear distribution [Fusarium albosuccineum]|uniref:RO-10 required for nuclear distribution n=1 Tax=Fusarium albosuccineum TaxID=1237068 RepID=A0A8H4PEA0_9HYPO|nr:RO-10 required for nuclear distribution [Fusarium albosuccineum]
MATTMDDTTLSTLDLLESRLLRIEHLLYGQPVSPALAQDRSAVDKIGQLERRFSALISAARFRPYGELIKIYQAHPDFFHAAAPSDPPSQLSADAIQSIVLASASAFPSTLSSLTAIKDSPIPDPSENAALIALQDRMKAIEATQVAQAAEIADLRRRSETVIRSWYETGVLENSRVMADLESRVEVVERQVRRAERELEAEDDL